MTSRAEWGKSLLRQPPPHSGQRHLRASGLARHAEQPCHVAQIWTLLGVASSAQASQSREKPWAAASSADVLWGEPSH